MFEWDPWIIGQLSKLIYSTLMEFKESNYIPINRVCS